MEEPILSGDVSADAAVSLGCYLRQHGFISPALETAPGSWFGGKVKKALHVAITPSP